MNYKCFFFGHIDSIIPSKNDKEIHVYGCCRCYTEYEDNAKFKMYLDEIGRHWNRIDIKQVVYVVLFGSWVNNGIVGVYNSKTEAKQRVEQLENCDIENLNSYHIEMHEVI